MAAFILISLFVVAVLAGYQIHDSIRHHRLERELNQNRYKASSLLDRQKHEVKPNYVPAILPEPTGLNFCGELDPTKKYKNGDVVSVQCRYYVYCGGKFEHMDV